MRATILAAGMALAAATPVRASMAAGTAAYARGDYAVAEREWRPLAEAGDAEAQYRLGTALQAQRTARDSAELMELFDAPAVDEPASTDEAWPDPFAETSAVPEPAPLTRAETEAQFEEAKWFRRAAEQGHPLAQFELHSFVLYREQNPVEALMWLLIANKNERSWYVLKSHHFESAKEGMTPEQIAEAERRAAAWKPHSSAPAPAKGAASAAVGPVDPWWRPSAAQRAYADRTGLPLARVDGQGQRFVLIPPGIFRMGSPEGEWGRNDSESQHEVELTRGFYMAATEVTNAQYRRHVKNRNALWKARGLDADVNNITHLGQNLSGDEQPVVVVDHDGARRHCSWLTEVEQEAGNLPDGWEYRLPTEAEWEYACRAGSQTRFWWGDSEADAGMYANVRDRTSEAAGILSPVFATTDGYAGSAPVASYQPNAFGLYDMIGNVSEWCADRFSQWYYGVSPRQDPPGSPEYLRGTRHADFVNRGGSWFNGRAACRCASRYGARPDMPDLYRGFRVVLAPIQPE